MNGLLLLKSLHVLSAIVAVGSNITYAAWSRLAGSDDGELRFALRGIRFLDQRIANPAYGVLLVTGLIMTFTSFSITRTWIIIGLVLFVVVGAMGGALYSPWLQRQMDALESGGSSSPAYQTAAARSTAIGLLLVVLVVAIVVVMVVQPQT